MPGNFNLRGVGALYLDPNPVTEEVLPDGVGQVRFDANFGTLALSYKNQSQSDVTTYLARGETETLAQNILTGRSGFLSQSPELLGAVYLPSGNLSSSSAYLQVQNQQGQQTVTFTVQIIPVGEQNPVATFAISADPQQTGAGVVPVTNPQIVSEGWHEVFGSCDGFGSPCLVGGIRLWIYPVP